MRDKKQLWVPFAKKPFTTPGRGLYRNGPNRDLPEGMVIHYAANRIQKDPYEEGLAVARYGKTQGHSYFVICRDGTIIQTTPLNQWGSHAGKSKWTEKGERKRYLIGVSQYYVGVENCNPGILKEVDKEHCETWYGVIIHKSKLVHTKQSNRMPGGWWLPLTAAQKEANIKLILWLAYNDANFCLKNTVAHSDVSPDRKVDPGGTLWTTAHINPVSVEELIQYIEG